MNDMGMEMGMEDEGNGQRRRPAFLPLLSRRAIQSDGGPCRAMQSHAELCRAMQSYAGRWPGDGGRMGRYMRGRGVLAGPRGPLASPFHGSSTALHGPAFPRIPREADDT